MIWLSNLTQNLNKHKILFRKNIYKYLKKIKSTFSTSIC